MIKLNTLGKFFLPFIFISPVFAQTDSLQILNAKWSTKKLDDGVVWKRTSFSENSLFKSNQVINILEIKKKVAKAKLRIAYSDSLEKTSTIGERSKGIAATNGSFFKMRGADPDENPNLKGVPNTKPSNINKNRSVVYLKVKDSLISKQEFTKDSVRKRHQQGVVLFDEHGISILEADTRSLKWESELSGYEVISSGPVMLLNKKELPIPNDAFCNNRHPRTAIGIKKNGDVILFVVDGRTSQSSGMSIPELQKTLLWMGCMDAINLDGGGSTTMFVKGQPFLGVVNHPSDNKKFDHEGEREVANAIIINK